MRLSALFCLALAVVASPALAIFALVPADRVDEVPIERLLANLDRNTQNLEPAQRWRAIGRVHLLAYLKQAAALPVFRERPDDIAEGRIDDCEKLDAQTMGKGNRENFPPPKPGERCEARSYTLGPRREVPNHAFDLSPTPNAHLRAAIDAYLKARNLEPANLRTRLALAFAFDRAGKKPLARNELRFCMNEGLKRTEALSSTGPEPMEWDLHVVLEEAAEHFSRIAKKLSDKHLIARVKARLEAHPPAMYVTPILVPLEANAAFDDLIDRASPVKFDFTGQGGAQRLGWLNTNAAWLVWDPKDKRTITSGYQLFGSVTWVAFWDNGYQALGALDDNGDGRLAGTELKGLALWRDLNLNGISDRGEVKPVAAHGIMAFSYAHERVRKDLLLSRGGVTFKGGEVRPTYDWVVRPAPVVVGSRQ
ncbi:MAG: hypothetical protein KBA31_01210 [Alphaproteobacteria bacterium]|nr:hypothetical protein [Alphaproteobacteria bacterium]